jgi:hypothetical protein
MVGQAAQAGNAGLVSVGWHCISTISKVHYTISCGLRASAKCQAEKRKTINGDDLLWAMETLQVQMQPLGSSQPTWQLLPEAWCS